KKYRYNDETDYYITEIPSTIQLRVGVANDKLGTVQSTLDFARDKKATLAFNAGVFNMETNMPLGIVIKDGEIIKDDVYENNRKAEVLTIDKEGVLSSYNSETTRASDLLDNDIIQAVQG